MDVVARRHRRAPSPDSACEHDGPPASSSSSEDPPSDLSEEAPRTRRRTTEIRKGLTCQDSDVDSGIVACRKPGQRIGSTSSADTDSSQESRRRIEYSPPIAKSELNRTRSYVSSLRIPRRSSCVSSSGGPIKADHSALKECNRRPPTPLTVFPDSHQCVRFDEQLPLSEQNIRRSCRKLFATLYAQRFHPPPDGRTRSRTVPELELHRHQSAARRSVGSCRTVHKSVSDASLAGKGTPSTVRYRFHTHSRFPVEFAESVLTNSTDSGLGSLRSSTHCTCRPATPSSHSSHHQCTCPHHHPAEDTPPKLFKSSSCSTLSHQSRPQLTQFPPPRPRLPQLLHKTSSCSSLVDRTQQQAAAVLPVYSDSMVQVYARMASVVPAEDGRRTLGARQRHHQEAVAVQEPTLRRKVNSFGNDAVLDKRTEVDAEIYSRIPEDHHTFGRTTRQQGRGTCSVYQRPKSVGVVVPSCGPHPVYLKSALKKSTQAAMLHVKELSAMEQKAVVANGVSTIPCEVEYAVVDKSKKNRFTSEPALSSSNNPSITVTEIEEKDPPVPPKKLLHKSDFSLYRSRSSSPKKGGLLGRVQSLGRALQKAFSTERIYRPEREERMELTRSRSFIKGITNSFRRKKRKQRTEDVAELRASPNPEWDEQPSGPNSPIHVRGQLLQLNLDGSQVVELTKPQGKPYGFFVARGRVRNSKGIFVSRMRDQETQKHLAGLLDIGDEILEIDGVHVKDAEIMEVNRLMSNKNTLLLTILPLICRKDI